MYEEIKRPFLIGLAGLLAAVQLDNYLYVEFLLIVSYRSCSHKQQQKCDLIQQIIILNAAK